KKNTVALYNLGYIYNYGLGIPRDEKQAAKWYGKAAELGSMSARNSLALYYSRGAGNLPVDRKRALDLLKSSACQGYAVAQNNLGILYLEGGDEISKDVRKSYAWFSVAFYNGIKTANEARKKIATYMDEKEAKEAENLAREYINNYPTSINGSDTNKSDSQCRLPAY
ncbi:sel1 repeat family protein, partial [Escherichia coli]